jgi:hypothetical protein
MQLDPEVNAMNEVLEVFKYLRQDERIRIIDWIKARFNLTGELPKVETFAAVKPAPTETIEEADESDESAPVTDYSGNKEMEESMDDEAEEVFVPQKRRPGRPKAVPVESSEVNFGQFDSIEELFLVSDVKKVSQRILLAAAYIQEKGNLTEVSSLDINKELKKLGYGVTNITTLINGLTKRRLMDVTKKEGSTKQARRKFKVTPEGFKVAKLFVKET